MKARQKKSWHLVVTGKVQQTILYLLKTSSAEEPLFESSQELVIELLVILRNSEIKPNAIAEVKEQLGKLLRKTSSDAKMRVIHGNLERTIRGI
jgi:hypothetical protein